MNDFYAVREEKSMSLISVIIPCYNSEKYVDRCLNSLINQTIGIDKLELILVDDASTDNTAKILTEYERKYPENIILIRCEKNGRQGTARNIGMQYASSPYIAFVDSDDWIEPDMYEKMYDKMVGYDVDVVFCQNERDDGTNYKQGEYNVAKSSRSTGRESKLITISNDTIREAFLVDYMMGLGVWDKLYKRELLYDNNICFPEGIVYEDIYFCGMLYFYVNKVYLIEEKLYHYFVNSESTVMGVDKPYHYGIFTAMELKLEKYIELGAYNRFPLGIEYDFIKSYYLAGLKILFLRYTNPSYDTFLHIKNRVLEVAPNYKNNPFLKNAFTEIYELFLELLEVNISENEFKEIAKLVKKIAKVE